MLLEISKEVADCPLNAWDDGARVFLPVDVRPVAHDVGEVRRFWDERHIHRGLAGVSPEILIEMVVLGELTIPYS